MEAKSLFIITIGPAGSGKGYVENVKIPETFFYVRIDDCIEIDVAPKKYM